MLLTKIIEMTRLRNRLNEEKRMIDRKISIINNLINTSWYIENNRARQIRSSQIKSRRIMKQHDHYDYIEDYKRCSIYQNTDNGLFIAYDYNDPKKPVSRGFVLKMIKHDIDNYLIAKQ